MLKPKVKNILFRCDNCGREQVIKIDSQEQRYCVRVQFSMHAGKWLFVDEKWCLDCAYTAAGESSNLMAETRTEKLRNQLHRMKVKALKALTGNK